LSPFIVLSLYADEMILGAMSTTEIIWMALIGAGIVLCTLRLLKGPTAPDRAVAVDTAATITTALLVLLGSSFGRQIYLDVALVYAVLTFVGSVAIARFLEKGI
jgi:multicomponent Na+:H+ antiporter subunit F